MRSIRTAVGQWVPDRWLSWWDGLDRWLQRAVTGILGIVALVVVLSVLYHTIMIRFEGRSPAFGHSVQVVVETFTGTGYGSDSPWETPVANAFVTAMDLSTFLVLFIVFPYVFQPVLESALAPTVPTTYEADGHVVVCGVPRLTDRLVTEFADRETDVVVVAADRDDVLALRDDGIAAIHGDPTSAGTLRQTSVDTARAAVVDTGDERAASVVLAVRETDSDVRTVAVVDHPDHEPQLRHAGADSVITPRQLVGRRLAERVRRELDPARSDTIPLDDEFSLIELTVAPDGPLAGETVDAVSTEKISVVGLWADGRFVGTPAADTVIEDHAILLLSGSEDALTDLEADSCRLRDTDPTVLVAGHGIVGSTLREALDAAGLQCRVIDSVDGDGVDVVGDATSAETLDRAGIAEADVFVVALNDDDATVLSLLAADEVPANPELMARMNDADNEIKLRRAGADYLLGVSTITGRLLVEEILDEAVIGLDRQLRTDRIDGSRFAGQPVDETPIAGLDCVVVGIERDGTFHRAVPNTFEIYHDDRLVVVGTDEAVGQLV